MSAHGQPKTPTQPSRLGGYELLEQLGEGGMGAVWRARQISLNRIVALKILPAKLAADPKYVDSFLREARSAARLNHPNIVHVYDAGEADGVFYYAMEFVRGETLFQWIKREGALPEKTVVDIALCVATALKHAWDTEQLIHRDVKPDNVMIDAGGNVKLCDLGLAKNFGENTLLSMSGQAFGTPNYMSPEQARAERAVDCRSDIYSLGLSLYHAVTGQIPFHGGSAALVMARHVSEQLPDPRDLEMAVSDGFCRVLQKMTAKDAAERYATWDEVIADLELARRGESPRAREVRSSSVRFGSAQPLVASSPVAQPPKSRLPILVPIATALILALALGGWFLIAQNPKPKTSSAPPPDAPSVVNTTTHPSQPPNGGKPPSRAEQAAARWQAIQTFADEHPDDLAQLIEKLRQFIADYSDAPQATEARELLTATEEMKTQMEEAERRRVELEAARLAEQQRLAEQVRAEAEARAAAEKAFVAFTQPFLQALSQRDYAGARKLAEEGAADETLAPLKAQLIECAGAAAQLENFWNSLPKLLSPLKGKPLTVQNVSGVLTGIEGGELVLERKIGDSGAVAEAVALSKLATDEILALLEQAATMRGDKSLLVLAWFGFAEGKTELANGNLIKAHQAGSEVAPVRDLMTLLAQGPVEDTTRKLLAATLAAIEQKNWAVARQKLRQLQARVEATSSVAVPKSDLLAMEEKVALGEWNDTVARAKAGTVLKTLKVTTSVPLAAMSPDGRYLLAGYSGELWLCDVVSGDKLKRIEGSAPSFHPMGTLVFVKKRNDVLTLFEVPSGKEAQSWGKEQYLYRMVFSPDGRFAFGVGAGKDLKLWDVGSGKLVPAFANKTADSIVRTAVFSPDSRYLLTGGTSVQLWEIATGKIVRELGAAPPSGSTIQNRALSVGFNADGTSAYVCWFIGGKVVGWETTTGKEIKKFQAATNPNGTPDGAVFSSSGRFVMTNHNSIYRVFEIESGKQTSIFPAPRYTPSFGFGEDELIGFYGDGHRGTVTLWKIWDGDRPPAPPLKR